MRRIARRLLPLLAGFALGAGVATAQESAWAPDRPVRLIMPGAPGSGADAAARVLAARMQANIGQPIVVENNPSGGGTVGIMNASRARKDGLTVLSAVSGILLGPLIDPALPYDLFRDFAPVSQIHTAAGVLTVSPQVQARTLEEFVALARAQPERFSIGTYGHGSASHVHAALLVRRAGLATQTVAYPSSPPVIRDILAQHILVGVLDSGSASAMFRDRTLRPLAVSGPRRLAVLPDVPTFVERGFAGFEPSIWQGIFLPAGTPEPVIRFWAEHVMRGMQSPEVVEKFRELGFEPLGTGTADFIAFLRQERQNWNRIIEETGIRGH